jgi:quinol-cytochrome oxidoreductase complex cytochrome b subunit
MTHRMHSPAKPRRTYRRFFARTAVVATILVIGLFGLGLIFPPEPTPPYALSAGGVADSGFPWRGLQMLAMVGSLMVAIAAFVGLVITRVLKWLDARRARKHAKMRGTRDDGTVALTTEPANERLRALRAVTTSSIEETPAHKT